MSTAVSKPAGRALTSNRNVAWCVGIALVLLAILVWPDPQLSQPRPVHVVEPLAVVVQERDGRVTTLVELPGSVPTERLSVEVSGRFDVSPDPRLPDGLWTARTIADGLELRRIYSTREAQGLDDVADYNGLYWQTGLAGGDLLLSCHNGRFGRPNGTTTQHLQVRTLPQSDGPTRFRVEPFRREWAGSEPHWIGCGQLVHDEQADAWLGVAAARSGLYEEARGCALVSVRASAGDRWRWTSRPLLDEDQGWLVDWAVSAPMRRAYLALVSPPGELGMWSVPDRLVAVDLDDGSVDEVDTGLDGFRGIALSPDGETLAVHRAWAPESDHADRLRNIYDDDLDEEVRQRRLQARSDRRVLLDVRTGAILGEDSAGWTTRAGVLGRIDEEGRAYRLIEDGVERTLVRITSPLLEEADELGDWARPAWQGLCWSPGGKRVALEVDVPDEGISDLSGPIVVLDLESQTFVVVRTLGGLFAWTTPESP